MEARDRPAKLCSAGRDTPESDQERRGVVQERRGVGSKARQGQPVGKGSAREPDSDSQDR